MCLARQQSLFDLLLTSVVFPESWKCLEKRGPFLCAYYTKMAKYPVQLEESRVSFTWPRSVGEEALHQQADGRRCSGRSSLIVGDVCSPGTPNIF